MEICIWNAITAVTDLGISLNVEFNLSGKKPLTLILINTFPLTEYLCLLAVGYGWERNHDAFSIH